MKRHILLQEAGGRDATDCRATFCRTPEPEEAEIRKVVQCKAATEMESARIAWISASVSGTTSGTTMARQYSGLPENILPVTGATLAGGKQTLFLTVTAQI
jgi:hypothetical protein